MSKLPIDVPKEKLQQIRMDTLRKVQREKRTKKRIVPIAVVALFPVGLLLSIIMIGMPFLNKNGEFQVANFAITAYASSDGGNQLTTNLSSEKATFELSTENRGYSTDITGDSGHLIYTSVMLNVSGEHIDSITYIINKGKFIKDLILTPEEVADEEWLFSEKILTIGNTPGEEIYYATKEIGNTYTVKYNEQDKIKYSLVIPHDGNLVIDDDIVIKVIVKYKDGKSEQQDILVTQESNLKESKSISLKVN